MSSYPMFGNYEKDLRSDFFDEFLTFDDEQQQNSPSDIMSGKLTLNLSNDSGFCENWDLSLQDQFHNENSYRACISHSELLSLEGITLESPQIPSQCQISSSSSPTPTPAALSNTNHVANAHSKQCKKVTATFDKATMSPIQETVSSPSVGAADRTKASMNSWKHKQQQNSSKFTFNFHENSGHLTPPLTCRVSDICPSKQTAVSEEDLDLDFANNGPIQPQSVEYTPQNTPQNTPILQQHSRNTSSQYTTSPIFPITPKNQKRFESWSLLPQTPRTTSGAARYVEDQPLWYNHAATVKMAQPSPSPYHTNPQRITKTLAAHLQNELICDANEMMPSGLMIQMPGMSMHMPSSQREHFGFSSQIQQGYFGPRSQRARLSYGQYTSSTSTHRPIRNHVRRERATHESSDSESPSESNLHVRKRRLQKMNKKSTPRTSFLGGGVDFVNYTPSDSKKILTGVAPSGSSKTKARREKEAQEKRRKLSQAAVRAVKAAGGNVDSLLEEGLFV